jgi:hypothetical protein
MPTKQKTEHLTGEQASIIAVETSEFYYADNYGVNWLPCIVMLSQRFSPRHVMGILASKHMRWAADESSSYPTASHLQAYMEKYPHYFTPQEVEELAQHDIVRAAFMRVAEQKVGIGSL